MKSVTKYTWLLTLLLSLFGFAQAATAQDNLATAQPITKLIADPLLADTGIDVSYLPPKRLPWKRIPSWLRGKATKQSLGSYTAVLTLETLRPEMAVYGLMRKENIAVIPVDLSAELTPGGSRISPKARDSYFWLHPGNLQLMLNIAAADLSRIWPAKAEQIQQNYQQLRKQLLQYQLQLDGLLLDAEIDEVLYQQANLTSIAQSLALPMEQTRDQPTAGKHQLVVELAKKKAETKANHWQIDPITRLDKRSLMERLDGNLAALKAGLNLSD